MNRFGIELGKLMENHLLTFFSMREPIVIASTYTVQPNIGWLLSVQLSTYAVPMQNRLSTQ